MTNLSSKGLLQVSSLFVCIIFTKISVASNAIIPFAVDKFQDDFAAKIASGELQEITVVNKKRRCEPKKITNNAKNRTPGTTPILSER